MVRGGTGLNIAGWKIRWENYSVSTSSSWYKRYMRPELNYIVEYSITRKWFLQDFSYSETHKAVE